MMTMKFQMNMTHYEVTLKMCPRVAILDVISNGIESVFHKLMEWTKLFIHYNHLLWEIVLVY